MDGDPVPLCALSALPCRRLSSPCGLVLTDDLGTVCGSITVRVEMNKGEPLPLQRALTLLFEGHQPAFTHGELT